MKLLITGGAGYIGGVAAEQAAAAGHDVVVLDNLSRARAAAVSAGYPFACVDLLDADGTLDIVRTHRPDAVLHFAALAVVPESVRRPAEYFRNNVVGSLNLLEAIRIVGVGAIVFSSTAAVYGEPAALPIREDAPLLPVNPYGRSKLMVEQMLETYEAAYGLRYAALRYFNVAGATEARGEDHEPETHVIPLALATAAGRRPEFAVFGSDYPTPDGTAIRDYVHVVDLVDAHLAALERLMAGEPLGAINLGTKAGFSVRQVVEGVERVTGRALPVRSEARRAGDPPILVADSARAHERLRWTPRRSTLDEMIGSAWSWMERHPQGYRP